MSLKRRLRGIIGTALTWSAAFGLVTVGVALVSLLALKPGIGVPWRIYGAAVLMWSVWGFVSGATYAGLLIALERKRTLSELSWGRLAVWGVVAGAIAPLSPVVILLAAGIDFPWSRLAIMCASGAITGLASAQLSLRAARGPFYRLPVPRAALLPSESLEPLE